MFYGIQVNQFSTIVAPYTDKFNYSTAEVVTTNSTLVVGFYVGGLICSSIFSKINNRKAVFMTMFFNAVLFNFIFSISENIVLSYISRFIVGVVMGFINPFYGTPYFESTPHKYKNFLSIVAITGAAIGQMIILLLMYLVMPTNNPFLVNKMMIHLSWVQFIIFVIYCLFYQENPYNLIREGREKKAFKIIQDDIIQYRNIKLTKEFKERMVWEAKNQITAYDLKQKGRILDYYNSDVGSIKTESTEKVHSISQGMHWFDGNHAFLSFCNLSLLFCSWYIYFGITSTPNIFKGLVIPKHSDEVVIQQIIVNGPGCILPIIIALFTLNNNLRMKWSSFIGFILMATSFILCIVNRENIILWVTLGNCFNTMLISVVYRFLSMSWDLRIRDHSVEYTFLGGKVAIIATMVVSYILSIVSINDNFYIYLGITIFEGIIMLVYPENSLFENEKF